MSYSVDEENRRPLKSRSWPMAAWLTAGLVRCGVAPNAISVMGMIFGIISGLSFAATAYFTASWLFVVGSIFVQFRLLCNLLDGMVAVQSHTASKVGELYNELPDRFSDAAIVVGLGFATNSSPVLGALAAAVAILTAYVRAFGASQQLGQDFRGPMAKPQRMFVVTLASLAAAFLPDSNACRMGLVVIILGGIITVVRRTAHIYSQLEHRT